MKSIRACLLLLAAALALPAQVIKIGSIAPDRSPWNDALKEIAREWQAITRGQIRLKIYPGGIAGNEEDMIRKMKVGILGGAVLTNIGLTKIYPDAFVLSTPFMFHSEKEMAYVLKRLTPIFEQQIKGRGFQVIIWTMSGWVNFFTKDPIQYPQDLKKQKLAFSTGEPALEQAWKKSGYHIVPTELKDLMMALQSGMVNAFYLPPLVAGSGQYFPLAPNMCPLKVAPLVGGMVIEDGIWSRIPGTYKQPMMDAVEKVSVRLAKETAILEDKAMEAMKKHGLRINEVPADSLAQWKEAADKGMDELIGKVFGREIYEKLLQILREYRQGDDA
ncbi:MAG: TRAP transporter substrate-binding protein DctP [Candidatus Aminicenantes bacterium]|nr:TRAP transporter substrate-binding protein DctP [Candidatus Aminicenantes bacterium]